MPLAGQLEIYYLMMHFNRLKLSLLQRPNDMNINIQETEVLTEKQAVYWELHNHYNQ